MSQPVGDTLKTFNALHILGPRADQRCPSDVNQAPAAREIYNQPISRDEVEVWRCARRHQWRWSESNAKKSTGRCSWAFGVIALATSVGGGCGAEKSGDAKPTGDKVTPTSEAWAQPTAVKAEPPPPATLAEAVVRFSPNMQDTADDVDIAAVAFGSVWLTQGYPWAQLQALPTTSFGKIKKDSDTERGKRLCASGLLVQISAVGRSMPGAYEGILVNDNLDAVSFLSVGSTGELVEKQGARFCGVVTGKHSYSNSGGGTTHSVYAVGMFDLPENKKPTSVAVGATTGVRPSSL